MSNARSGAAPVVTLPRPEPAPHAPGRRIRIAAAFGVSVLALALLAVIHLTQGTSEIGAVDLLRLARGHGDEATWNILLGSRLPRLAAALVVGVALGVAGAVLQSVARNALASPDTLAVSAGAYLAVTIAAAFGLSLPLLPAGGLAFVGGLGAAVFVLLLSAGGASGPTRLVLAGSATALAFSSVTALLLLLFEEQTKGLFAWGSGSLVQADLDPSAQMAPIVVAAVGGLVVLGHRLDILALGDDTAASLGLPVRRTRVTAVLLAVLLTAAAVTVAGPIGFVGLCAPVIVRLAAPLVPGLLRHRVLLPLSGVAGALIVVGADVLLRAALGGQGGVDVPTGVVTSVVGAVVLVLLARQHRDAGPTRRPPAARTGGARSRGRFWLVLLVALLATAGAALAGMLLGDTLLLTGDVLNWLTGASGPRVTFVLNERMPRVAAALLAGAALAIAGVTVQAACRNPLAEPGILGITAGASLGAVSLLTFVPLASVVAMSVAAGVGALVAFALVYGLAWRRELNPDRLVLIGIGLSAGFTALTTLIVVVHDPWNTAKALTWLSGSTYGRTFAQVVPVLVALLVLTPVVVTLRRELDLMALDDDTPRVLGVRLEVTRLAVLTGAALLASTAVSAVGAVGFAGLVAPHVARALVGPQHRRVIPVAAVVGALLVSLADTLGRFVIAPAQVPAGLLTALLGTPYFVWLLWRSRA
ncbi:iron ABC transporter permease [Thermasporomyces composti]|uniref:Iron complex transport system permease protein n=1 Tax=Thermasporomyces composti TaxID=696763 RepID=A0A3D9VC34_THECX|nr:iron ABC transporter permease [Thermasporomyces composti]REF35724.1 iron complex transport system permease protein [Thermasporomyces composti]